MATKKTAAQKKAAAKKAVSAAGDSPQKSALELIKSIEKGSTVRHIELRQREPEDYYSTGVISLDLILGGGGLGGRVISFVGAEHSSKSTVAYSTAGEMHKRKILTPFLDFEGTTERAYAAKLGMVFDDRNPLLRYYKPDHGPAGYDLMIKVLQGLPDCHYGPPQVAFIIDSIATMPTEKEMADWTEADKMAGRARMHSEWIGRLKTLFSRKNVAVLAVNQVRSNLNPYGNPETFPGGRAWMFAIDVLVKFKGGKEITVDGEQYRPITFKTIKNKNFQSGQEASVLLHLGHGVSKASDVLEFTKLTGIRTSVQVGKTKAPVVQGLDKYGDGSRKFDKQYRAIKTLEDDIQADPTAWLAACKRMLDSGEALKQYMAVRKAKGQVKEAKEALDPETPEATLAALAEDEDADEEQAAAEAVAAPAVEDPDTSKASRLTRKRKA